jgi:hypothetical protein
LRVKQTAEHVDAVLVRYRSRQGLAIRHVIQMDVHVGHGRFARVPDAVAVVVAPGTDADLEWTHSAESFAYSPIANDE